MNDVGLALREDSEDALEISGHEICRFLLFLPESNECPTPLGCFVVTVCLASLVVVSSGGFGLLVGDCFRFDQCRNGHLFDDPPDLLVFQLLRCNIFPLLIPPNGVISFKSEGADNFCIVEAEEG